jgi:predicted amidohydrolase YtcJ
LRGAEDRLKGVPSARGSSAAEKREAIKKLFSLYNQHGLTSIADKAAGTGAIDLYRELAAGGELTLRINCTRRTSAGRNRDDSREKLDQMAGAAREGKLPYGPTGVGDEWVRIGPLKVMMDGGMLIGSAYMREPWGVGPTYQITDPEYRGILNQDLTQLKEMYRDAAARGWQLTAHVAGEGAMDALLDVYEHVNEVTPVAGKRMLMTHANFLSQRNIERCKRMGVVADLQPAWLYKDGASLLNTLGERRMQWFLPFKTWMDNGLIVGGGSDHMTKLDPIDSINPWSPWLGIWVTLTRHTERGGVLNPAEKLTREQALRFYTINNAYLGFAEKEKGSLEVGKLADVILVDRDVLTCPIDDVKGTKVLWTMVGGKLVWQAP